MEEVARTRKKRDDAGKLRVTDRDIHVLKWIGEQRVVPYSQIAVLLGRESKRTKGKPVSLSSCSQSVRRWINHGWCKKVTVFDDTWVWLTISGLRLAGIDYVKNPKRPSPVTFEHSGAVGAVRLYLEYSLGDTFVSWESEREIYARMGVNEKQIVPDGIVTYSHSSGTPVSVAIEVELTVKTLARYPKVLESHHRNKSFEGLLYYVNSAAKNAVKRQIDKYLERKILSKPFFVEMRELKDIEYDFSSKD